MSRFRYYILPRLLLALSTLALLAALFLLWLSLERPLPTIALACRQAGPTNCFTGGELLASGPIRLNYAEPDADAWTVLRSWNQYATTNVKRTAGLLWIVPQFSLVLFSPEPGQELFPCPTASYTYYHYNTADSSPSPYFGPEVDLETIPLAICTNPSVVRLEGELLWLGSWEDPQEALAQRGVSISWSPAENGVWVGEPVLSSLPTKPNSEGRSGTLSIWLRGYDAAGNLVCSYDPTA